MLALGSPALSNDPQRLLHVAAQLKDAISAAWGLQPQAFRHDGSAALGLVIALLAGLSKAIGQAFILFLNRVRPLRFFLCLVLEAVLFAFGFLVWALTTWWLVLLVFRRDLPLSIVIQALGIAHAPQLLAFLGALPYLGSTWLMLLSLYTAIAFVVGLAAVTGLSLWSSLACLIGGWLVAQAMHRCAGQPLSGLLRRLEQRTAGVRLERDRHRLSPWEDLEEMPAPRRWTGR